MSRKTFYFLSIIVVCGIELLAITQQTTGQRRTSANISTEKGGLSIFVRDSVTGYGVDSQVVVSTPNRYYVSKTSEGGILRVNTNNGRIDLSVSAPGYEPLQTFFYVSPNDDLKTEIWLDRASSVFRIEPKKEGIAVVSGYVVDGGTGKPLEGVNVLFASNGTHAETNEDGYFRMESTKISDFGRGGYESALRETIAFTKKSFGEYVLTDFPLLEGVFTLRITLTKGAQRKVDNYHQDILEGEKEQIDQSAESAGIPELHFFSPEHLDSIFSPQSCPALPATIRVGTGCPSPTNCSVVCSGTVQTMTLESYVRSGLDNEWISSWLSASLRAGAVAYRSYGVYYILNQPLNNPNYDIRSDTCNQAWGPVSAQSTMDAANSTSGEVIVNGSNVVVKSEYSSENNDLPSTLCGDGFSGTGTTWPCISDSVCAGFQRNGHGRGMCQYGSSRWAIQGQAYTWILDHYYNPGSYSRCSVAAGALPDLTISAGSQYVTPTTVAAGSTITAGASEGNSGTASSAANVMSLYLSTDDELTPGSNGDTFLGSIQFSAVPANSNSAINFANVQIPVGTAQGTYYLFFWADGGQVVSEINDKNNFATRQITVTSALPPTITIAPNTVGNFGNVAVGQNSTPQSYLVSGSNLTGSMTIQAPSGFQISLSQTFGYTSTLILTGTGGLVPFTTVYARFSPQASGSQSGNIVHSSSGAATKNVFLSGNGTPVSCLFVSSNTQFVITSEAGGAGSSISVTAGCSWVAQSDAPWLTTSSVGTGNGPFQFQATANLSSSPRTGHITFGTAVVTVIQLGVGGAGVVQFATPYYGVNEGVGVATLRVIQTTVIGSGLLNYATIDGGTAIPGIDYLPVSGQVFMDATQGNATFDVPILDDGVFRGTKTLKVAISSPSGIFLIDNPSTATITIFDNDSATPANRRSYDFDSDGKTDVSVFRPSSRTWYLNQSSVGFAAFQFGASGDKLAPADFTGDGKTDVAVWRPSDGVWYVLRSEDSTFYGVQFGTSGDVPAPADYDGDGKADQAVFRPSSGIWYIQESTAGFSAAQFGASTDVPTLGDFDGDGKADIAVFRASNGVWYRLNSSDGSFFAVQFGSLGDKVVAADYTGDGKTDIAVWRPSNGTWYILKSEDLGFYGVQFGLSPDLPVPGDYDGDGRADIAVYRPSEGNWYLLRSTSGFAAQQFGISEDKPTPNAFVY